MNKISLSGLHKLNKLMDQVEDYELLSLLERISADLMPSATQGNPPANPTTIPQSQGPQPGPGSSDDSTALVSLFDFCADFKDKAQELVRAAIEEDGVDPTKLLSVSGNLEKSVTNFLQEISELISTEQGLNQDNLDLQVQQAQTPSITQGMGFAAPRK